MKQVDTISLTELKEMSAKMFEAIVKADVDIAQGIVVVDMGMHADGEAYLLENGSAQTDVWGINLHPDKFGTDEFVEFDSMINIRPSQGNASKDVLDEKVRTAIIDLVHGVVNE
ncbi:hypothetical protein COY17_01475 [Candidatus Saccharibacteria bacterium CG_4_10_14_0_2_um_filter_52_9]|nr:MAG: hypothetical protein COY17_01475 [Candidatus Saccharibacteria bacterium CG_4_10_14_0_2_um_filter_52_9]